MINTLLLMIAMLQPYNPPYYVPEPIVYDWLTTKKMNGDNEKYNGYYYYLNNEWIPGVVDVESQYLIMPDLVIGSAWAYGPEMMLATAHHNNLSLDGVEGGVAIPFCSEIGNYVWLKRPYNPGILGTGEWEGPFLVSDCAGIGDLYNVTAIRNEVVEIDFDTARYWTMVKDFRMAGEDTAHYTWDFRRVDDVIVSKIDPELLPDDLEPVVLSEWFKENATYFTSQEEADDHFYKQVMVLNKYDHENRIMSWRIDGEWRDFQLNEIPVQLRPIPTEDTEFIPIFREHEYQTPEELIDYKDNWIEIDLSEQVLYLHKGDKLAAGFRISSGKRGTETNPGLFKVYSKYSKYTMSGVDYYTENIPWVMFYHGEFSIHGAFWHDNFGTPMSHGCVNMTVNDAEWVYNNIDKWSYVYIHE